MSYGDKPLGLKSLVIAALDPATGTYGTPVTLPQGRKMVVKVNNVVSELNGYMAATDAIASVIKDAEVTIDGGTVPKEFLAVALGMATATSGTTPDETTSLHLETGKNLPYFGVIGVSDDDDSGDTHIGLSKVKLTEMPEWSQQNEDNLFVHSEMTGRAIKDANGKVVYIDSHETAGDPDFTTIFA